MLITYLSTRKIIMPFKTMEEMYFNTDFRLALIPNTAYEDDFKYSADPIIQKVYEERFKPHLTEYLEFKDLSELAIRKLITDDYGTAVYSYYEGMRY